MKTSEAVEVLHQLDERGMYVFTKKDLAKFFPSEKAKTVNYFLQRLMLDGFLERVCNGVYLNPLAKSKRENVIEDIAFVLRKDHYSYFSLETVLSEYGDISRFPVNRITLMTTGPDGVFETKYGVIEFTHTKHSFPEIAMKTVYDPDRRWRVATREAAKLDLLRVGRKVPMQT